MATKLRQSLRLLFFLSSSFLFLNSSLVVYKHIMPAMVATEPVTSCKCPKCPNYTTVKSPYKPSSPPSPHRNPSFTPIDYFLPSGHSTLPHISQRHTLTRIGNELVNFDPKSCPTSSYIHHRESQAPPLHTSCPAVFIIGARKGGTTSLYHYLSGHPQFEGARLDMGPTSGETFHFSARYTTESWSKYMNRFPKQHIMTGDASVGNFVNCKVPQRVLESCGNFSKIIILLRNPVERYVSNFLMRVNLHTKQFTNHTTISTSVKLDTKLYIDAHVARGIDLEMAMGKTGAHSMDWNKLTCLFKPSSNMVYEGVYYVHVMNWLCNYPLENIMIVNSEEFFDKPADILKEVYQFLGMEELSDDQRELISSFVYNKRLHVPLKNHMLQETDRRKLQNIYKSFNDRIFKLLNWKHDQIDWH